MTSPTAGKQEGALVLGSSIVAGFGADLYGVPLVDWIRYSSQFKPTPPVGPQVVTFTGATGRVNLTNHGWPAGTALRFVGGSPPPEITPGVPMFVANPDANSFQVYTQYLPALSGAHIPTFTGDGTGTTTAEPTAAANRPYEFKMPGVRLWTPRRPWCNNTSRLVNVATLANAVTHQGDEIDPTPVDQWSFVQRGIGRGNLRRVVIYDDLSKQLLMAQNFDVLPVNGDKLVVLQDTHTIVSLSADGLTVTVTNEGPPLTTDGGDVGRFCSFLDSPSIGETLRKITANADRTMTLDQPLTQFPCASAPLGAAPVVVTFNDGTERVNHTAHGYSAGQAILFAGGTTPTGVSQFVALYVTNPGTDDYQLALTRALALAGTNFAFAGSGSGTTTVKPLPTFDAATAPVTVTFDHPTERVLHTAHGFPNRRPIAFATTTTLPAALTPGAVYFTANVTANDYQVSATPGGAVIPLADNGTGTHTVAATSRVLLPGHGIPVGAAGALAPVVFEGGTTPASVPQRTVRYAYDVDAVSFKLAETWLLGFGGTTVTFATSGTGVTTCKRTVNGVAVLRGGNACHDLTTMQPPNAVLQDCTFALDELAPVLLTGLDYPNWDSTPFASPRAYSGAHTFNAVPELAFHCKSRVDNPLVMLELGVSASMLSTFPMPAGATVDVAGPLRDMTSLDWAPSSPFGIHGVLVKALESMHALVAAENNDLEIPVVFFNCTDNDHEPQRLLRIGANLSILRQEVNEYVVQLTGQATPPAWIISGPARYQGGPGSPGNDSVYLQLEALRAANPTSVFIVDTRSYDDDPTLFAADGVHFSALGEIRLARDWFNGWLALDPENQTDAAGDSADDGGSSEDDGGAGGGDSISAPTVAQEDELQAAMYGNAGIKRYRTPSGLEVEMESAEDTERRIERARIEASRKSGLRQTRARFH